MLQPAATAVPLLIGVFVGAPPPAQEHLGVLVGQLTRRTLPAMSLTGALVATAHGLVHWARPSFHPTVDETAPRNTAQPTDAWLINREAVMPDGSRISSDACPGTHRCDGSTGTWLQYHPSAHPVPIQLVEAGILLALTLVVLTTLFLRIPRRGPRDPLPPAHPLTKG
ncbi:hypothetical protein [Kitasatospora aureofaciens]|uniref:hypothetical protein n=1 Tax=Kitasatospora aureofaciens TaxID=1894 RepID=UPI00052576B6|nr:hypothetical protein [Kitasatospora aureofaciens]